MYLYVICSTEYSGDNCDKRCMRLYSELVFYIGICIPITIINMYVTLGRSRTDRFFQIIAVRTGISSSQWLVIAGGRWNNKQTLMLLYASVLYMWWIYRLTIILISTRHHKTWWKRPNQIPASRVLRIFTNLVCAPVGFIVDVGGIIIIYMLKIKKRSMIMINHK